MSGGAAQPENDENCNLSADMIPAGSADTAPVSEQEHAANLLHVVIIPTSGKNANLDALPTSHESLHAQMVRINWLVRVALRASQAGPTWQGK